LKSFLYFTSIHFRVSGVTLWYLIHFECIFVHSDRQESRVSLLHVDIQFSQQNFFWRGFLFSNIFFQHIYQESVAIAPWVFSRLSVLFHWSICLFYVSTMIFLLLWFCSVVWNQVLWPQHYSFCSGLLWLSEVFLVFIWVLDFFSSSVKTVVEILGECTESVDYFFKIVVLGRGTLWYLQRFLQYIKYITLEFTPLPFSFIHPNCWNSFNSYLFFCLHSCIHSICIIFILLHPFPAFSPFPLVSTHPPGRICSAPHSSILQKK
jgi:hypothetical protein